MAELKETCFTSVQVATGLTLNLIIMVQGVEELCTEYQYVEQRQGWAAEERRISKELDKHGKQAAKVSFPAALRSTIYAGSMPLCSYPVMAFSWSETLELICTLRAG